MPQSIIKNIIIMVQSGDDLYIYNWYFLISYTLTCIVEENILFLTVSKGAWIKEIKLSMNTIK